MKKKIDSLGVVLTVPGRRHFGRSERHEGPIFPDFVTATLNSCFEMEALYATSKLVSRSEALRAWSKQLRSPLCGFDANKKRQAKGGRFLLPHAKIVTWRVIQCRVSGQNDPDSSVAIGKRPSIDHRTSPAQGLQSSRQAHSMKISWSSCDRCLYFCGRWLE